MVQAILNNVSEFAQCLETGDILNVFLVADHFQTVHQPTETWCNMFAEEKDVTEGAVNGDRRLGLDELTSSIGNCKDGVKVNVIMQTSIDGVFARRISAINQRPRSQVSTLIDPESSYVGLTMPSGPFSSSYGSGTFLESFRAKYDAERSCRDLEVEHGEEEKIQLYQNFLRIVYHDFLDIHISNTDSVKAILMPSNSMNAKSEPTNRPTNSITRHLASHALAAYNALEYEYSKIGYDNGKGCPCACVAGSREYFLSTHHWEGRKLVERGWVGLPEHFPRQGFITNEQYFHMYKGTLNMFRWSFRIQEAFWHVFEILINKGLVSIEAINQPIN